jgi:hypothetical protein
LAHEGGHVIYDRSQSDGSGDPTLSRESLADLTAALVLVAQDESVSPAIQSLSILSFFDPYLDWNGEAHGPFTCRAKLLQDIYSSLALRASILQAWAERAGIAPVGAITDATPIPAFMAQRLCDPPAVPEVATARRELDALLAAARIATSQNAITVKSVNALLAVRVKTSFGAALRAEIISRLIEAQMRKIGDEMNADEENDQHSEAMVLRQTVLALSQKMDNLLRGGLISAKDQAHFKLEAAYFDMTASFHVSPDMLKRLIDEVRKYDPLSADIPFYEAMRQIALGQCKRADSFLKEADRLDPDAHYEANFPVNLSDATFQECALLARGYREI